MNLSLGDQGSHPGVLRPPSLPALLLHDARQPQSPSSSSAIGPAHPMRALIPLMEQMAQEPRPRTHIRGPGVFRYEVTPTATNVQDARVHPGQSSTFRSQTHPPNQPAPPSRPPTTSPPTCPFIPGRRTTPNDCAQVHELQTVLAQDLPHPPRHRGLICYVYPAPRSITAHPARHRTPNPTGSSHVPVAHALHPERPSIPATSAAT